MVRLTAKNVKTTIVGQFDSDPKINGVYHELLRQELSYMVDSADYSPSFKEKKWDGRISLYQKRNQTFPTGLMNQTIRWLKEEQIPYTIDDERYRPISTTVFTTRFEEFGRELRFYQEEACNRGEKKKRGIFSIATGGGKSLDINTPILTKRGWLTMGDVVDGDCVFDENGQWCNVIKAHQIHNNHECFEILFSTGEKIIADEFHLWTVRLTPAFNRAMPRRTITTSEIAKIYLTGESTAFSSKPKAKYKNKRSILFIDKPKALQYQPNSTLPIEPYVLGAWLGDGASDSGHFTNQDDEIISNIRDNGFDIVQSSHSKIEWGILKLAVPLRELGLKNNKHIPIQYLNSSFEDRIELLKGIVDTDGSVALDGQTEISVCNEKLANDILELVRSLGFLAKMTQNKSFLNGKRYKDRYRIKFTTSEQISSLSRKAERLKNGKDRLTNQRIYIKSIKKINPTPVRCLTVDSPSRLYLVGKTLIPTHNTLLSCELLTRLNVAPFLFIVPSQSLLEQTRAEFVKYLLQDGEIPHIGMIGDGVCDINPNGINVATYQSLLAAHDEKYQEKSTVDPVTKKKIAGNQIVQVPEKERKSLVQLEAEEKEALRIYKKTYTDVQVKYQSELQSAEHIAKDTEREKKIKSIEKRIEKECKNSRELLVKAKNAIKNRQRTLANQLSVRELCINTSGFIVDEAHMAAVIIESLSEKMHKALYRFGLSATPFREDNQEIRITGAMGEKLIEVSASDLIDLEFLVPPYIYMVRNNYTEATTTWSDTYNKQIVNCWPRNYRIKQFAEEFKESGYPTIILVEQKEHGYLLESMIKDSVFVPGSAKGDGLDDNPDDVEKSYRRLMLDATERNEIILIATQWANVGIDAPKLMALILAGSNKSAVTTYQQIGRILRPVGKNYQESILNGKPLAIVIDFMEEQKILHKHSVRRKKVYQGERSWNVSVVG